MVSGPSQIWALDRFNLGGQEPSSLGDRCRILGEGTLTDGTIPNHQYVVPSLGGDACGDISRKGAIFDPKAVFSDVVHDKGEIICPPPLLDYGAKELDDSANVQKQLGKADEECELAQKSKRGTKKREEG